MLRGKRNAAVLATALLAACGSDEPPTTEVAMDDTEAATIAAMEEEIGVNAGEAQTPREIRDAECLLWPSNYRGDCRFDPRGRGSFSIRQEDGAPFYDAVTEIMVMVFEEGKADIRTKTADGTSVMLGEARRSEAYPACWIGSGFSVCAY